MIIIDIYKQGQNGTMIFNILDNTTELWMTKYIIGEIFSSGGATLCKNPSDQTVTGSFIIVEEMDSIKKNCRVISRKKILQYIISANKTKQTNKKTTEKEISI